jgi:hypothetical protein
MMISPVETIVIPPRSLLEPLYALCQLDVLAPVRVLLYARCP